MGVHREARRRGSAAVRFLNPFVLCLLSCLNGNRVETLTASSWGTKHTITGRVRCALWTRYSVTSEGDSANKENDDMIGGQERLQDAISSLFSIGSTNNQQPEVDPSVAYSVPNLEDPSSWQSLKLQPGSAEWKGKLPEQQKLPETQLNSPMEMQGTTGTSQGDGMSVSDGFQVDTDGVFLDASDYIHSRDWMNADGSLNIPANPSSMEEYDNYQDITESVLTPNPRFPEESSSSALDNLSLEDVMKQPRMDPSTTSEELHKKVFENEEGFLKQSEEFRKALTHESARDEAVALRRSKKYRERQAEIVAELEQQIQDFEEHYLPSGRDSKTNRRVTCSKCGCAMSEQEIHHFEVLQGSKESKRLCQVCYADVLKATSQAEAKAMLQISQSQWEQNRRIREAKSFLREGKRRVRPPRSRTLIPRDRKTVPTPPPAKTQSPPRESNAMAGKTIKRQSSLKVNSKVPRERKTMSGQKTSQLQPTAKSQTTTDNEQLDQIESLTKQLLNLKRLVQNYKRRAEMAEQEIFRLQNTIAEMDDDLRAALALGSSNEGGDNAADKGEATISPWTEVEDPDTGETFFWNEETEEMRWEL